MQSTKTFHTISQSSFPKSRRHSGVLPSVVSLFSDTPAGKKKQPVKESDESSDEEVVNPTENRKIMFHDESDEKAEGKAEESAEGTSKPMGGLPSSNDRQKKSRSSSEKAKVIHSLRTSGILEKNVSSDRDARSSMTVDESHGSHVGRKSDLDYERKISMGEEPAGSKELPKRSGRDGDRREEGEERRSGDALAMQRISMFATKKSSPNADKYSSISMRNRKCLLESKDGEADSFGSPNEDREEEKGEEDKGKEI